MSIDFPQLPGRSAERCTILIPHGIAALIHTEWPVYRHPDGGLVSDIVQRIDDQWEAVFGRERLYQWEIATLTTTLLMLRPGEPPGGWGAEQRQVRAAALMNGVALARRWRLRLREPALLERLAAAEGLDSDELKAELVARGLMAAISERRLPQDIRIDREWVARGVRPVEDVSPRTYLRWLAIRARRIARESLSPPMPKAVELEPPPASVTALEALEISEENRRAVADLQAHAEGATPAQRRLLGALEVAYQEGAPGLSAAVDVAASNLGISPKTAWEQIRRLRKKADVR